MVQNIKKDEDFDDEEEHYFDVEEDVDKKVEMKPQQKVIYVKGKAITKLSEGKNKKEKETKPAMNGSVPKGWVHRKDCMFPTLLIILFIYSVNYF